MFVSTRIEVHTKKGVSRAGLLVCLWVLCGFLLPLQPASGTQAPDFSLPTPEGKQIRLSVLQKRGPVLIDFWATWCKPCIKAMPKLVEIHERYKDRGLTVLGINEDGPRSRTKVKPFIRARKITIPVVIDSDGRVMRRFQVTSLPSTLLVAPDGEILLRLSGFRPSQHKDLLNAIEAALPVEPGTEKTPGADRAKM